MGKPKLLEQVRDVIRRKHYSIRTEQAYVDWIKRFIIYSESPAQLQATRLPLQLRIFFSVVDHFTVHRAAIESGQIFFHCRGEQ